jgi:hypothetical protein
MEEVPPQNTPVQRLKVTILPLLWLMTHSKEIIIIGKSHKEARDH